MVKKIVVAGGCFWGVQEYYRRLKGILTTKVGYAQGFVVDPVYTEVKTGSTLHAEVVYLEYDPTIISLTSILEHLFRMIDPTSLNRQGGDIGTQYRTGVYYYDDNEAVIIRDYIAQRQKEYRRPIVVECEPMKTFYDAETYHQDYLVKNPQGYCHVDFSLIKEDEKK